VEWALLYSDYLVMLMPPPTESDWTGLRGLQGISGDLWKYKLELAQKYDPIKEALHAVSAEVNEQNVWDAVFVLATQASYLVNMANTARIAIDDYHHDLDKDWFRPMLYSFAVISENELRKLIALHTSSDDDWAALLHRSMMLIVLNGDRFPDVTFREEHKDRIKQGLLSLPTLPASS
jgi:hypothetical protein